jgi:hypothetical protein
MVLFNFITARPQKAIKIPTSQPTSADYQNFESAFSQPIPGVHMNRRDTSSVPTASSYYAD